MSAADWQDLLDGLVYAYAQPIYWGIAIMFVLALLAGLLRFAIDVFTSRSRD